MMSNKQHNSNVKVVPSGQQYGDTRSCASYKSTYNNENTSTSNARIPERSNVTKRTYSSEQNKSNQSRPKHNNNQRSNQVDFYCGSYKGECITQVIRECNLPCSPIKYLCEGRHEKLINSELSSETILEYLRACTLSEVQRIISKWRRCYPVVRYGQICCPDDGYCKNYDCRNFHELSYFNVDETGYVTSINSVDASVYEMKYLPRINNKFFDLLFKKTPAYPVCYYGKSCAAGLFEMCDDEYHKHGDQGQIVYESLNSFINYTIKRNDVNRLFKILLFNNKFFPKTHRQVSDVCGYGTLCRDTKIDESDKIVQEKNKRLAFFDASKDKKDQKNHKVKQCKMAHPKNKKDLPLRETIEKEININQLLMIINTVPNAFEKGVTYNFPRAEICDEECECSANLKAEKENRRKGFDAPIDSINNFPAIHDADDYRTYKEEDIISLAANFSEDDEIFPLKCTVPLENRVDAQCPFEKGFNSCDAEIVGQCAFCHGTQGHPMYKPPLEFGLIRRLSWNEEAAKLAAARANYIMLYFLVRRAAEPRLVKEAKEKREVIEKDRQAYADIISAWASNTDRDADRFAANIPEGHIPAKPKGVGAPQAKQTKESNTNANSNKRTSGFIEFITAKIDQLGADWIDFDGSSDTMPNFLSDAPKCFDSKSRMSRITTLSTIETVKYMCPNGETCTVRTCPNHKEGYKPERFHCNGKNCPGKECKKIHGTCPSKYLHICIANRKKASKKYKTPIKKDCKFIHSDDQGRNETYAQKKTKQFQMVMVLFEDLVWLSTRGIDEYGRYRIKYINALVRAAVDNNVNEEDLFNALRKIRDDNIAEDRDNNIAEDMVTSSISIFMSEYIIAKGVFIEYKNGVTKTIRENKSDKPETISQAKRNKRAAQNNKSSIFKHLAEGVDIDMNSLATISETYHPTTEDLENIFAGATETTATTSIKKFRPASYIKRFVNLINNAKKYGDGAVLDRNSRRFITELINNYNIKTIKTIVYILSKIINGVVHEDASLSIEWNLILKNLESMSSFYPNMPCHMIIMSLIKILLEGEEESDINQILNPLREALGKYDHHLHRLAADRVTADDIEQAHRENEDQKYSNDKALSILVENVDSNGRIIHNE